MEYSFSAEVRDMLRYAQGICLRVGLSSDEPDFWRAVVIALLRDSPEMVVTSLAGRLGEAYELSAGQHAYVLTAMQADAYWAVYGVNVMQRILRRSQVAELLGQRLADYPICTLQLWGLVLLHSNQFSGELQVAQTDLSDIKDLCRWSPRLNWPDVAGFVQVRSPEVPPIRYRRRLY